MTPESPAEARTTTVLVKPTTNLPPVRVATPARRTKKVAVPQKRAKAVEAANEVERMVRRLESDWKAAVERHQRVVGKQFHELRAALHVKPGRAVPAYLKDTRKFRKALDTRIKPKRGRAKDLKRVEEALGAALARLPEA